MEWTTAQVQKLTELKAANKTWKEIGTELNRTAESAKKKYKSLEKLAPIQEKITACKHSYSRVTLRACLFDIEVTDFHAGGIRDHFICMSALPLDSEEITTVRIAFTDNRDDQRVLKEARDLLAEYQIVAGHFITGFDLPWMNSRLAYHHMECLPRLLTYDTYFAARRIGLRSDRKSLAFLGDFLRLENRKTSIYPVAWGQIDSPDRKEFEYALVQTVEHCEGDVRMNREVFDALWAIDRSMVSLPMYRK